MPASVSMIFILFQHMTKRKLLPKRNDKSCMASMSIKFMQEFPVQINPSSIDRMKRKEIKIKKSSQKDRTKNLHSFQTPFDNLLLLLFEMGLWKIT